jgi:hypothetical protein
VALAAEFSHEPQDFAALNALLLKRSPLGRFIRTLTAVLFALIFALAAAWMHGPGDAWWPVPAAAALGLVLGWLSRWLVGGPLGNPVLRLHGEVAFRMARREGLLVPQRVELTGDGLKGTSEKGETLTRWSGVKEVVRTEGHVFIFISRRTAFMAPRRAFPSHADFDAFAREAAEHHRQATARLAAPHSSAAPMPSRE